MPVQMVLCPTECTVRELAITIGVIPFSTTASCEVDFQLHPIREPLTRFAVITPSAVTNITAPDHDFEFTVDKKTKNSQRIQVDLEKPVAANKRSQLKILFDWQNAIQIVNFNTGREMRLEIAAYGIPFAKEMIPDFEQLTVAKLFIVRVPPPKGFHITTVADWRVPNQFESISDQYEWRIANAGTSNPVRLDLIISDQPTEESRESSPEETNLPTQENDSVLQRYYKQSLERIEKNRAETFMLLEQTQIRLEDIASRKTRNSLYLAIIALIIALLTMFLTIGLYLRETPSVDVDMVLTQIRLAETSQSATVEVNQAVTEGIFITPSITNP